MKICKILFDPCVIPFQPMYSQPAHGPSHLSQTAGSLTTGVPVSTLLDPHRLDAVKRAADSIIREKDMIIEK